MAAAVLELHSDIISLFIPSSSLVAFLMVACVNSTCYKSIVLLIVLRHVDNDRSWGLEVMRPKSDLMSPGSIIDASANLSTLGLE